MFDDIILLKENTPEDYVLRGFSQDDILNLINYDVGYHGNGVKALIKGIDRFRYKLKYVFEHNDKSTILNVLEQYANGLSKELVLRELGIAGANIVKLKVLFSELGYLDEFLVADKRQRRLSMQRGTIAKYGTDNVFKLAEFQEKAANTREEKYGAKYTLCSDSILSAGARLTAKEHLQDSDFKDKVVAKRKATNVVNLGCEVPAQSEVIRNKMRNTCIERYGVPHYMQTEVARNVSRVRLLNDTNFFQKSRDTCMKKYGVSNYAQTKEFRRFMSERMSNSDVQLSILDAKKQNHTLNTSKGEIDLEQLLVAIFGRDDVKTQYFDKVRYPFACDFYIVSRDMFIELNASWTHGGHWYNDESSDYVLNESYIHGSEYYKKVSETWSERDVVKRQKACDNNLNYVVFWDKDLSDAVLWLGMGCPDGQDWVREYSWLPERNLALHFDFPVLSSSEKAVIHIARAVNYKSFYHRECNFWTENPMHKRWGTLQARLYVNRYKYIGKLPDELTDNDILRGLSVSGLIRGYSVFHNSGMKYVIDKYSVKSMYDPCMGWGERLSTAGALGVEYIGCDINSSVVDGNQLIINHYNLQNCMAVYGDSSKYDMRESHHDCVFTCPPYEGVEIYTDKGAENLSHDDFLNWWRNVVKYSVCDDTKVFAYQINTRFKDDMNVILESCGWNLVEQVPVGNDKISHMNRSQGRVKRKYYDEVQIFVRSEL